MSSRKKTSTVWDHFTVDPDDEAFAICNHCGGRKSRGGKNARQQGTSTLLRHLDACKARPAARPVQHQTGPAATTSNRGQLTLTETFARTTKFKRDSQRAQALTRAIGLMIAVDLRPYHMTENPGFRHVMEVAEPRYEMPSRRHFTDVVIPNIVGEVKKNLRDELLHALPGISVTTDMWRSDQNKEYMCVTMHWSSMIEGKVSSLHI